MKKTRHIINLLPKAFKFTPHGGKIMFSVEADEEKDLLVIKVRDNGIGIPKEKQRLLFKRFMQTNFSASGTDIELPLVQKFAAFHKGSVRYAENTGSSSVFVIELPLSDKLYGEDDFVVEKINDTQNTENENPQENELSAKDHKFMKLVEEIVEKNITNSSFSVDDFIVQTNTSRTLFFKKIKSLTGYSPSEYMRIRRLQKAAKLLKTYKYNVSEVSYMIGIEDPFYFSKCFKAQFGCSPSKYAKQ